MHSAPTFRPPLATLAPTNHGLQLMRRDWPRALPMVLLFALSGLFWALVLAGVIAAVAR